MCDGHVPTGCLTVTPDVRCLGIDLAWSEGSLARPANRSGVVALDPSGEIAAAGWTIGLPATVEWIERNAHEDTTLFVDAPLVITNLTKQRLAEKQVGQRYGSWWVSANSSNLASKRQAGVRLRERLEELGWIYRDGLEGPSTTGRTLYECYPYNLLDAAVCAWTAALWQRDGLQRCQVLGGAEHDGAGGQLATIVAPARREQRRDADCRR